MSGPFLDECLEVAGPAWTAFEHHPWIEALFAGELDDERFGYWLAQDLPYLGQYITEMALPKVPPNNPLAQLETEYRRRSGGERVELTMLDVVGPFGSSRWAARPARDAFVNFWVRTVHEGSFGDLCAAVYVCYSFDRTFGERYLRERPDLPDLQRRWTEQWIDPFFGRLRQAVEDGLNEAGAHATEHQRDTMRWLFLRGVQYQVLTFDAAWTLSDPWPGEGADQGGFVAAVPPLTGTPHSTGSTGP